MVDGEGIQISYAGPYKLQRVDYSKAEWFKEALRKDHYVSDVFYGLRGFPHLVAAVRQEHNGKKWILRATLDLELFRSLVENIGTGASGYAFILSKDGTLQTRVRSGAFLSKDDYLSFLSSKPETSADVGIVEKTNSEGKEFVDLVMRLNDGAWVLVHHQRADDVYADLYAARRSAILAFLVGVVGIVIGSIVSSLTEW